MSFLGSSCINKILLDYAQGIVPADAGTDEIDVVCPTEFSILGLPTTKHFDPVTSQDGDALTSGPTDPGLAALGHHDPITNHTSAASRTFVDPTWLSLFALSFSLFI